MDIVQRDRAGEGERSSREADSKLRYIPRFWEGGSSFLWCGILWQAEGQGSREQVTPTLTGDPRFSPSQAHLKPGGCFPQEDFSA